MSFIDSNWFNTDIGKQIFQSVHHNNKLKRFGLLERPSLPTAYSSFEEVSYKILLIGKSNCGKTAFIESLFKSNQNLSRTTINYGETPGIHITNIYWPVKLINVDKFIMFKLSFWDVGKACSTKYDYILPSCSENLDCIIFLFSWTDVQSFNEIVDFVRQQETNNQNQIAKYIIGTKFDEIAHSDIRQDLVEQFETQYKLRIKRFSCFNVDFEIICQILNEISELLWKRDQIIAKLHNAAK